MGEVPRLGGIALLAGLLVSWGAGVVTSQMLGDPSFLRLGGWALWWAAVLLPAVLGGVGEDLTHRLAVRYRLALTMLTGALATALLGLAVPRLGLPWVDDWMVVNPWIGIAVALLAVTGLPHAFNIIDGCNGLAGMVALIVCLALAHVALQVGDRALAV
ncbi:MraY family glycosyltransferase, partial [Streptomyces sp. G35A]